ncbi:MAG TPA: type II CAAX endopeptidase family protein [Bryobacteraceae bacterium]|nr:type II CAAX endopeptidase family protein [Bryobacteraceae bacterium]
MQILVAVAFLSLFGALLAARVQDALQKAFAARPALIFLAALALSAIFWAIAAAMGAWNVPLALLILIYTMLPAACAFLIRRARPPVWADFAIILLLWLPLEFSIGERWTPRAAQGLLHMAAYGVSVTLGLAIFLLFRRLPGMKYNLPRRWRDAANLAIGFALAAAILIPLGRAVGFLDPGHWPRRWASLGFQYLAILAATALPEEILFRGMIQNALMQRWGAKTPALLVAALIFGCAHLDNGPGPLPNWRYMIVATLAGVIYGKVFEQSSSIFASAGLHALVNTIKHSFF